MTQGFLTMSYLTAGGLFILSLGGLSKHDSAERGNLFGIAGMTLAVVATLLSLTGFQWSAFSIALLISAAMGLIVAARVQMTSMPELVAILHSFVGLAAVFVAGSLYLRGTELVGIEGLIHSLEIYVGAFIGALTFTGSLVAFGKLKGMLSSKPLLLPGRHVYNLGIVGACVVLGTMFMSLDAPAGLPVHGYVHFGWNPWLSFGRRHRRRRYASRRFHVEQLFGMGSGSEWIQLEE